MEYAEDLPSTNSLKFDFLEYDLIIVDKATVFEQTMTPIALIVVLPLVAAGCRVRNAVDNLVNQLRRRQETGHARLGGVGTPQGLDVSGCSTSPPMGSISGIFLIRPQGHVPGASARGEEDATTRRKGLGPTRTKQLERLVGFTWHFREGSITMQP
ncbi:hypothetical protein CONLIGDRAFT_650615 [Coniochaeta ligniaria NRRL 30616]|uniref:Uncharacterized protein n=1 Tax=Coniochaeta ligniaria NRRL 30616 TaxID=1408157 RepID=A0A1J7IXR3_9PEZI|nr:hypothetical protein CONLIGDRAFT_650615 [Coniochaeta ligniaria NRRL 30616]